MIAAAPQRPAWPRLGLLWLMGADLRVTLLAVPPVLTMIHRDLRLSETGVGALTGLPACLLAAAAVPGSLLIARLSAARAAVLGLLLVAAASALRGVGPSVPVLFAMTFAMGAGISITQPAMPALVSQWFPGRAGLATSAYANGMLVGETAAAALTLPLVLALLGGRWEWGFVVWAVPVVAGAALLNLTRAPARAGSPAAAPRWWPDWSDGLTLALGFALGGASAAYWGSNAFIPDYLRATGRPDLIGPCLTALNAGQLPASFVVACWPRRMVGRRGPLMAAGGLTLAGLGTFLSGSPAGMVTGAAIIGFLSALVLILTLAMPPVLAPPDDVHRLSAGMLAVAYGFAFVFSVLGGAAWDASRLPAAAFLPVAAGALVTLVSAATVRAR